MPENNPFNSFNRDNNAKDPRTSGLFAKNESENLLFDDHEEQKSTKSRYIPTASSRRLNRIKHSQLRRNLLIAVSIIIGLLLALIATDTLKLGTGPRPYLSSSSDSFGAQRRSSITVAQNKQHAIRELTPQDPLRVYIGGDSLVGSFGNHLGTLLGETGVIKATYDSRPSSGLVNANFFNWNSHMRDINSTYDPEVIIFMIGTNDASIVSSNAKTYKQDYTKKLETFITIATTNNRKLFFVLAPSMRDPKLNKNVDRINDVIFSVAHEKDINTIESSLALSPRGKFTMSLTSNGKSLNIRADDGIHITSQGGKILAEYISDFLDNILQFSKYSRGSKIDASSVPGCCTNPKSMPISKSSSSTEQTTNTQIDQQVSLPSSAQDTSGSQVQNIVPPSSE